MFRELLLILSNTAVSPIIDTDLRWHPPDATGINDLSSAINSSGVYGFVFNTSVTPDGKYGGYNFCNMPHVRRREYKRPSDRFELKYVEVVRNGIAAPVLWNAFNSRIG
jgi:2-phosphoxylose phosphatase